MVGALRLQPTSLAAMSSIDNGGLNYKPRLNLRFNSNRRIFTALCLGQSTPSDSSVLTTSVGTASTLPVHLSQWTFTHRHIQILNIAACAAAVSATWLFCSAIPTLLAFKRAAESLEKLMDVTREELPGTMAAIRLSGMEISDLTMELSDIGQQFTQGVRNSTQAVRLAEERLRNLTTTKPSAPMQDITQTVNGAKEPVIARTAKGIRLGIVQGRARLQMLFTLTRFFKIAFNYFRARAKAKA